MRRVLFSFFLAFLGFFALLLIPQNAVYAACPQPLTVDQPTLASNFNSTVTISTAGNCFNTAVEYIVAIHPQSKDGNSALWAKFVISRAKPDDEQNIKAAVNLFQSALGKENPGTWIIRVCSPGEIKDCALDSTNPASTFVGSTSVDVSTTAPPAPSPPPADLPKVSAFPNQCKYLIGSKLTFIVSNLIPTRSYTWWWHDDPPILAQGFISDNAGSPYALDIPGNKTEKVGRRTLCVDVSAGIGLRCSPGGPNAVTLEFSSTPPTGDVSCEAVQQKPPALTPIPPFNPTKCTPPGETADSGIDTALGCIPTNLAGFVGKIFAIILGLAGGIALLLIIYSGYRMVTEGSNPEALQGARETLTSAIVGLLFIIFSFVILEVIGVDILRLPQFGGSGRTTTDDGREIPMQCRNAPYALDHVTLCGNQLVIQACNGLKTDAQNGVDLSIEDRNALARCVRESYIIVPDCLKAKFALENFAVCGELQTKAACSILREEVAERGGTGAATDEERATLDQCQQKGF